jgi:hypothetical protein
MVKKKIVSLRRESPNHPARSLVVILTELSQRFFFRITHRKKGVRSLAN